MTVIGLHVYGPRGALMWADSEVYSYRDGGPVGQAPKLMVNALAGLVATGTGWSGLLADADRAVNAAVSLESLVAGLPGVLRYAAARLASRHPAPDTFRECAYVVCGFSNKFRRLVAHAFGAEDFFTPRAVRTFSSPHVAELAASDPHCMEDITGTALMQFEEVRRSFPRAVGGPLTAAEITLEGITVRRILDLVGGAPCAPAGRGRECSHRDAWTQELSCPVI